MMGNLYRRPNSPYWWLKYRDKAGNVIRESSGSEKKSAARKLLQKRESEIAEGILGVRLERITLSELLEDLLSDYRVNGRKSLNRAKLSVERLKEYFGKDSRAVDIDTPKVKGYIEDRLTHEAAPASVNRELSCLKRSLNLAAKATPPKLWRVPHIPMLQERNVRSGFFTAAEFEKLLDALPEYLKGFCEFGFRSGWRFSEISGLTWGQVDRQQCIVRLDPGTTKNNAGRVLPLDAHLQDVIQAQWQARRERECLTPYVFTNAAGTGPVRDIRDSWRTACRKAGVHGRIFHDLRRSAVRNLVRAGNSEKVVMAISGHKTRSIFARYDIIDESDLRTAVEKQEAFLQNSNGLGTQMGTFFEMTRKEEKAQHA